MPDITMPWQIGGGEIHIVSVSNSTLSPARVNVATVSYPFERYAGSYEITPSDTEQTIETSGNLLLENITVKPIPSNWGRIDWNGNTLSVI